MTYLEKNLPTLAGLAILAMLFLGENRGWLTSDQVKTLEGALALGGIFGAHRMEKP